MPYFENHSKQLLLRAHLQTFITKPIAGTPALAALWIRSRMENIPQHTIGGLKQDSDRNYFIGAGQAEEPKKLQVFGRFFPLPKHKFRAVEYYASDPNGETEVFFNDGSDSSPRWKVVERFLRASEANDYIESQTSRIHLRVLPR